MKQKIYIDTSVIGGCLDEEFKEWSNKLFDEFIHGLKTCVLSDLTFNELKDAPQRVREVLNKVDDDHKEMILVNDEIRELANQYITENAITLKFLNDAIHIATATFYKIDILASWNFQHLVNINRIRLYNAVNLKNGYLPLEIRTPREILNEQ